MDQTAALLDQLGHDVGEVAERPPFAGPVLTPRYLAGVHEDCQHLEGFEAAEPRTRRMAAAGRRLRGRPLRWSPAAESGLAARLNRPFARYDLLLTPTVAAPMPAADAGEGKGMLRTLFEMMPYAVYTAPWNGTGQPAASVPAGFDAEGMPTAVQLVARPDEATLVALAAEIERARPWAQHRPPSLA